VNDPLTVKKIWKEIKSYLKKTGKGECKYSVPRRNPENVLVAFNNPFKGRCNKCGKRARYQVAKCTQRDPQAQGNLGGERFQGRCYFCNKVGHKKIACRKRIAAEESGNLVINNRPEEMFFSAYAIDDERNKASNRWMDPLTHLKGHFFGVWSNSVVRGTGFLQFGLTIRHF
jgi:hypothetical protein